MPTSSQGAMRPITSFKCPMVDSSWKSRGNVSVHSANSWSSLGPNFRTRACKASQGASAQGDRCLEAGPHQPLHQPRTAHALSGSRYPGRAAGSQGRFVAGARDVTQGWGLTTGEQRGTDTDLGEDPMLFLPAGHPISLSVVITSQFALGVSVSLIPSPWGSGAAYLASGPLAGAQISAGQ